MNQLAIRRENFFKRWGYTLFGDRHIICNPFQSESNNNSPLSFELTTSISLDNGIITIFAKTYDGKVFEYDMFSLTLDKFIDGLISAFCSYTYDDDECVFSQGDFVYIENYIRKYIKNVIDSEYYLAQIVLNEMKQNDLFSSLENNILNEKRKYLKWIWRIIEEMYPETGVLDCEKLTDGKGLELTLSIWGEEKTHKILDFCVADIPAVVGEPCVIGVNVTSVVDGEQSYDNIEYFSLVEIKKMYYAIVELLSIAKK